MNFGSYDTQQADVIAEINTTPLIDVLLVLLVVFLVTLPLATMSVPVNLPKAKASPTALAAEAQNIAISANGKIFWGDSPVDTTELDARFAGLEGTETPIRLQIDAQVPFESVAQVLAMANRHRLTRIEFITQSPTNNPALPAKKA